MRGVWANKQQMLLHNRLQLRSMLRKIESRRKAGFLRLRRQLRNLCRHVRPTVPLMVIHYC